MQVADAIKLCCSSIGTAPGLIVTPTPPLARVSLRSRRDVVRRGHPRHQAGSKQGPPRHGAPRAAPGAPVGPGFPGRPERSRDRAPEALQMPHLPQAASAACADPVRPVDERGRYEGGDAERGRQHRG